MWHAFLLVFRCSCACCYRRCCFLRIGSLHCVFVFALMVRFVVFLRKGNYQRLVAWGLRNDRKAWRAGFACTGIGRARGSCFRASFRLSMTWSCPRACMHPCMHACIDTYIYALPTMLLSLLLLVAFCFLRISCWCVCVVCPFAPGMALGVPWRCGGRIHLLLFSPER